MEEEGGQLQEGEFRKGKENLEWVRRIQNGGGKNQNGGGKKKALERIKKTEGTGRDKRKYDTRREKWDREKANTKFELGGGGKARRNRREEEGEGNGGKTEGGSSSFPSQTPSPFPFYCLPTTKLLTKALKNSVKKTRTSSVYTC